MGPRSSSNLTPIKEGEIVRSFRFSICLVAWFWVIPLFGQTPSLVLSGGQDPQLGFGNVVLRPPDYALQIECKGSPSKFKLSGEPNFNPSPRPLAGGWWECSGSFLIKFAYSKQSAELIL